jgi:dethiobiotin synthetase
MSGLVLLGIGTDVGKTFVACALITALRTRGAEVDAFKPVISGLSPETWAESDAGRLLAALGRDVDQASLDHISPFQFRAPLSPPMAARLEGRTLALADVVAVCRQRLATTPGLLLIETAGGVMSPLDDDHTMLDLVAALGQPSVLVAASYLGAISHTLTALRALASVGHAPDVIVVSESAGEHPSFAQTCADIARLSGVRVLAAPRGGAWDAELVLSPDLPASPIC